MQDDSNTGIKKNKQPYIEIKVFDPVTYGLMMSFKGKTGKKVIKEVNEYLKEKFG